MFPNIPQREARQAKQPAKKLAHVEQIQAKPKKDNVLVNRAQATGVASPTFPNIPQREARQVKLPEQKPRITRKVNHEQVKPVAPEKNLPRVIPSNLHDNHVSKPVKKESKPVTPSFQSRPTTASRSSARDSSRQAKIQEKKDIYDERVTLPDLPTVDDLPKHVHDEFDIDDAPRIEDPEPKPAKIPSDLRKSHNERNMQDYEYMQILEEQERLEREKERKEEEERRREKEEKAKAKKSEMSNQALLDEAYSKLPPEPSAGVTIAVMLFNKRIMRKFLPQEPGIDVYAWIAKESNGKLFLNNFEIAPVGGQKVEKEQTLEEQNIKGRTMLMITDI